MWPFSGKMNPDCPPSQASGQAKKSKGRMTKKTTLKRQPFERYVHKLVRKMRPDRGISRKGALVMSSFISDTFHRLAHEAGHLVTISKKQTMSNNDVSSAVLLVVRGDLARMSVQEASRALAKYVSSSGGGGMGGATARDGADCACPPPVEPPKC